MPAKKGKKYSQEAQSRPSLTRSAGLRSFMEKHGREAKGFRFVKKSGKTTRKSRVKGV